jgi:hypothetical protein
MFDTNAKDAGNEPEAVEISVEDTEDREEEEYWDLMDKIDEIQKIMNKRQGKFEE